MREVARAGAAEFLLDRDAVQPEAPHLGPQVARKLVAAVDLLGARRDLVLREVLHGLAQLVDLVAETEIEAGPRIGNHRRHLWHVSTFSFRSLRNYTSPLLQMSVVQ